jgi:uncharacterized protein (TIGR00255 family)
MTGFGRGEFLDAEHRFIVEIKSVNHRYNEIAIKMPKNFGVLEDKIRRMVNSSLERGRVDVYVTTDDFGQRKRTVRVDKELALAYHIALKELAHLLEASPWDQIFHQIAKFPDVLRVEEEAEDVSLLWPKLSQAIDQAIANLMTMRLAEGANIQKDLLIRIDKLAKDVVFIEDRAPQIAAEYREKLLARMRDILATIGAEPDELRLLQEAALFADRTNITEELVRLQSHLTQLHDALLSDDAVGRKLDFIIQEVNREVNTIGSKANDATVANMVLDIKSEMEKVREQIQNIE